MKTRTTEELSSFLRSDLSWRRKEIHVFHSAVSAAEASKQQALMRGAIAALYAHWEGFIKTACEAYLDFVKTRKLKISELCPPLIALASRSKILISQQSKRLDSHVEFIQWLLADWNSRAHLPKSSIISAEGNLTADVLQTLTSGLGLPYPEDAKLAEKTVIEPLLEMRNNLAHGSWLIVEFPLYERLRIWVERLIVAFCDVIEGAAALQLYKRQLPQLI